VSERAPIDVPGIGGVRGDQQVVDGEAQCALEGGISFDAHIARAPELRPTRTGVRRCRRQTRRGGIRQVLARGVQWNVGVARRAQARDAIEQIAAAGFDRQRFHLPVRARMCGAPSVTSDAIVRAANATTVPGGGHERRFLRPVVEAQRCAVVFRLQQDRLQQRGAMGHRRDAQGCRCASRALRRRDAANAGRGWPGRMSSVRSCDKVRPTSRRIGRPSSCSDQCVQSGATTSCGVVAAPWKTPATYVAGEEAEFPSGVEPRMPTCPLPTVNSDSMSCSRAGSKPRARIAQVGSTVGIA
jgi:hypothetical protein